MKIFKGEFYRITVLTDKLVRLEYSQTGSFEDRTTQLIYNRDFGQVSLNYTSFMIGSIKTGPALAHAFL